MSTIHDEELEVAESDAGGLVTLGVLPGDYWTAVRAGGPRAATIPLLFSGGSAVPYATQAVATEGTTVELGTIELVVGGSIEGVVVDEQGAAVQDAHVATVAVRAGEEGSDGDETPVILEPEDTVATSRTSSDGAFTLSGIPPGFCRVVVSRSGFHRGVSEVVGIASGESSEGMRVSIRRIPAHLLVSGDVVDEAGRCVPGAVVESSLDEGENWSFAAPAGEDGGFEFALSEPGPVRVRARGPTPLWNPSAVLATTAGTSGLRLRIERAATLEITVSDRGETVDRFQWSLTDVEGVELATGAGGREHPGRERIRVPKEPFHVRVLLHGYEVWERGPFRPDVPPEDLRAELVRRPGVTGRVVAEGRPVEGARVRLLRQLRNEVAVAQGFVFDVEPHSGGETITAVDGSFWAIPPHPEVLVRVWAPGYAAELAGPFAIDMREGLGGLEIELRRGATVRGRVLAAGESDPGGCIVGATRGDGFIATARVDESGHYSLPHLAPGDWQVSFCEVDLDPARPVPSYSKRAYSGPLPADVVVRAGETIAHDLILGEPIVLEGRLRLDGSSPGPLEVFVEREDGASSAAGVPLDPEGGFRVELEEPGFVRLEVRVGTDQARLEIRANVLVPSSGARWERDVPTGRIDLSGFDSAAMLTGEADVGFGWRRSLSPESSGTECGGLPLGTVVVRDSDDGVLARGRVVPEETRPVPKSR